MNTRPGILAFFCCWFVPLAVYAGTTAAADLTIASAIDKAGLQRMLIQRIGKAYCQIGLDAMPKESREQLHQAVNTFETNLDELEAFAPNEQIQEALTQVRELWEPVKTLATAPVSRAGANRVAYWSDDLLYGSHKVVQLLQDLSNTTSVRLVNISGRQRMLSQRLAKFYMLQVWGFDTLTIRDEVATARNEFTGALATLQAAPETTEAIRRQLDAVAGEWTWFQKALDMTDPDPFPVTVASATESILFRMNDITRSYQQLADQAQPATNFGQLPNSNP